MTSVLVHLLAASSSAVGSSLPPRFPPGLGAFCCNWPQPHSVRKSRFPFTRILPTYTPGASRYPIAESDRTVVSPSKQSATGKYPNNSETAIFVSALGRSRTSPVKAF